MHAFGGLLDHLCRHITAEVDLDHDIIGVEVVMAAHHGLAHCAGLPVVVRSASTAKRPSLSNAEATIPTSSLPPDGSTPTVTCSIISSGTSSWISQSSLNSAFMGSGIIAPCSSCRWQ